MTKEVDTKLNLNSKLDAWMCLLCKLNIKYDKFVVNILHENISNTRLQQKLTTLEYRKFSAHKQNDHSASHTFWCV